MNLHARYPHRQACAYKSLLHHTHPRHPHPGLTISFGIDFVISIRSSVNDHVRVSVKSARTHDLCIFDTFTQQLTLFTRSLRQLNSQKGSTHIPTPSRTLFGREVIKRYNDKTASNTTSTFLGNAGRTHHPCPTEVARLTPWAVSTRHYPHSHPDTSPHIPGQHHIE
jgi:hypothetical protein